MAKIPFSIEHREKIESGEYKVETRDGRDARIICWDSKAKDARFDTRPIIALVTTPIPGLESLIQCGENGILYKYAQDRRDLFIVTPEEKLTEFEKKLLEVLKSEGSPIGPIEKFTNADKDVIHSYAAELLSLARKQLQPEIDAEIEKAYKTADEVQYRKGREEALKDLPMWKKCDPNTIYNTKCNFIVNGIGRYIILDGYMIDVDRLEKLPGFKEDEK